MAKRINVHLNPEEKQLTDWFLELYQQRTPPRDINEALPEYRVNWHEIYAKAETLGVRELVMFRVRWTVIFYGFLRTRVNKMLVANGERPLPPANSISREIIHQWGTVEPEQAG